MLGVAVSQTGSGETLAIVVDDHRTEAYLIASVPVYIGDAKVMVSVAIPGTAPSVVIAPFPVECQLVGLRVYGESLHVMFGVASATQENVGVTSVEERSAEVVLRRAVAVAVAPVAGVTARQGVGHPQRAVGADGVGLCRGSLHIEQILVAVVSIGGIGIGLVHSIARVGLHVANLGGSTVGVVYNHVVGTTHEHLGFAVSVPVVAHGIVLLIGSADHVRSEVDIP